MRKRQRKKNYNKLLVLLNTASYLWKSYNIDRDLIIKQQLLKVWKKYKETYRVDGNNTK